MIEIIEQCGVQSLRRQTGKLYQDLIKVHPELMRTDERDHGNPRALDDGLPVPNAPLMGYVGVDQGIGCSHMIFIA